MHHGQAVARADQQVAGAGLADRVDLVVGQPVARGIDPPLAAGGEHQAAFVKAHPHAPGAVLQGGGGKQARPSFAAAVDGERVVAQPAQPGVIADPQVALAVARDRAHGNLPGFRQREGETLAVETRHAAVGSGPDQAVAVAPKSAHHRIGQPLGHPVAAQRAFGRNRQHAAARADPHRSIGARHHAVDEPSRQLRLIDHRHVTGG